MNCQFISLSQKVLAISLTMGIVTYLSPVQAVMYGAKNELSGLRMNVNSCIKRAYRAVNAVSTHGIQNNNRGYSGAMGQHHEVTISINCTPVGDYSAVNISVIYIGSRADMAESVRNKLRVEFLKN